MNLAHFRAFFKEMGFPSRAALQISLTPNPTHPVTKSQNRQPKLTLCLNEKRIAQEAVLDAHGEWGLAGGDGGVRTSVSVLQQREVRERTQDLSCPQPPAGSLSAWSSWFCNRTFQLNVRKPALEGRSFSVFLNSKHREQNRLVSVFLDEENARKRWVPVAFQFRKRTKADGRWS
jgi:hypothetical protein